MAGGPINGGKMTGVVIPTVLQMASDVLNYFTGMTCLYDRYWSYDPAKATLPISVFHVKKIVPTYMAETSKKRVIMYEPQVDNMVTMKKMNDLMRESVMQTVMDNVVKQPTTYSMEIIVPFQPMGRFKEGIKMVSNMVVTLSELLGGGKFAGAWESAFSTVLMALKTFNQITDAAGKLPDMNGIAYINMNSLEAMASSGRLLCMKMWTGYDYKYVVVTGMTSEKQPLEDDVYRVNLSLQEMPILAVSKPKGVSSATGGNWVATVATAVQAASVVPLIAFTRVKTASGDDKTGMDIIKEAVGGS